MPNGSYGVLANGQRIDMPTQGQAMPAGLDTQLRASGQSWAEPNWDQPKQQRMDPRAYLSNAMKSQLDVIQSRLNVQWDTVRKNARHLGNDKANAMLAEVHQAAKVEADKVYAGFKKRADALVSLEQLGSQGQLGPNPDKVMWGVAAGEEIAEQMFPKQDPFTLSSKVSGERERLEKRIAGYHVTPAQPGEVNIGLGKGMFGLAGLAYGALTSKRGTPETVSAWDPDAENRYKDKKGVWVREIGKWVESSTPDKDMQKLAKDNKDLQLLNDVSSILTSDITNWGPIAKASASLITGENPQGTFGDKASASKLFRQSQQQRRPGKKLDMDTAKKIFAQAGGDKERAKQLARQMGYDDEVE